MKLLECEFGVVTQHVSKQTVDKVASGRGALLVYNNILQKMNMKLGGINWDLSANQAFLTRNKTSQDVVKTKWLNQARMFIGIDMSHAGPQSFVERNQGVPPSEPTIVGMAFTAGHPLLIRGTYWCQKPRLTIVDRLADKVAEALEIYHNVPQNKGNYPNHIVVFRGGISEGDYAKVITSEEQFFKQAFANIKKEKPDFREPILTIIVVQRTSNYRIVPQNPDPNAPPAKQNVPAGTVVDRGVMHPTQTEFLLVAHKAIQGTAHPIKCTVVYDNGEKHGQQRMSLEETEYITYHMCYGHAIVSSPVSVPAPLYSAGDLAKRGRNNWKAYAFGGDAESSISGEGGRARNSGDPNFWVDLSESLKPRISTKFWA
uniref:Piwi domain-containing protein n=1 Tax=Acrobeloides nanus TaxID=290746 RepID=A0A914ERZ2_9BILA